MWLLIVGSAATCHWACTSDFRPGRGSAPRPSAHSLTGPSRTKEEAGSKLFVIHAPAGSLNGLVRVPSFGRDLKFNPSFAPEACALCYSLAVPGGRVKPLLDFYGVAHRAFNQHFEPLFRDTLDDWPA